MDDVYLQQFPQKFRTCDQCHAALNLPNGFNATSPGLVGVLPSPAQPNVPSSPADSTASSDAGASDVSELSDCPVCSTHLSTLGGREEQEAHVQQCLESGGGSLVQTGRYLVFKLPAGPLVSEECRICFDEFVIDDKLARLPCLCYFHQ